MSMADNQFQLQQFKHVNSVNTDISDSIYLESKAKNMVNYDLLNTVNAAEQFESERQSSLSFKIYGGMEYFSPLSNIPVTYSTLSNIFSKQITAAPLKISNSFDIYLLKPHTSYTQLNSVKFIKKYQVIGLPGDIDLMDAAFSRNIFFERKNIFTVPKSVNLTDQLDGFGKPVTDLYLYFHYKGTGTVTKKVFNSSSTDTVYSTGSIGASAYALGDTIDGELLTYEKKNFFEETLNIQEYFIEVTYTDESATKQLKFKYNPFYKIKVREYGAESIVENVSATTVENTIPSYAVQLDSSGNYLWHDLLDFGYIDPVEDIGVNFPFVNGSHYVFSNIILSMRPDMTHSNTATVFNEISFASNQLINTTPTTGLNNAGKIC
jgi:hypothetical protein